MHILSPIKMAQPLLNGRETALVLECIRNNWISSGPMLARFEDEFAHLMGVEAAVACSNGTAALHLTLAALGIGAGDEVIVPSLTFVATANAVRYTGARPVFVDVTAGDWCMSPEGVAAAISPHTKAIIAVHLYGAAADLSALQALCERHHLYLIEDSAEALGTLWQGQAVGTVGIAGCFSFYANKTITTGEGGMICTNDAALAAQLRLLRGHGQRAERPYWHEVVGYNYRLTDLQAAIGVAQLEHLAENLYIRRQIALWYQDALPMLEFQTERAGTQHSWWMSAILLPPEVERDGMIRYLAGQGIESRPIFYPLHQLPIYATGQHLPISEAIARRGIVLPSHVGLRPADVMRVAAAVMGVIGK